jgi:hypothetical protein
MKKHKVIHVAPLLMLCALLVSGAPVRGATDVTSVSRRAAAAYSEGDDYFTLVWGNPRDMDDPNDVYALHSSCGGSGAWTDKSMSGGIWSGRTTAGTWRYLFLLNPGWASSLDVGEDGQLAPIDTGAFTQLAFRMRVAASAANSTEWVVWSNSTIGTMTGSTPFQLLGDGQWHVYTIDLSTSASWSGQVVSLYLQLNNMDDGNHLVELDWAELTPGGSVPADPVPIAEIVAPSYLSGEDWATTVAGDPWDMDSTGDIDPGETRTLSYSASGGVLDISNSDDGMASCSAPWPHRPLSLNLHGQTIDTSKYRYFTYRYKVDNAPDQGDGGVSRVRWLLTGEWVAGRTDDISLYNDGWNTYKVDLATADLEAETAAWQSYNYDNLHILVHESHDPWPAHLDWVKLTAENEAHGSYTVGWNLLNVSEVDTTTIYWDADRNPGGLIGGWVVTDSPSGTPTPPPGPLYAYLPLAMRTYGTAPLDIDAEHQFTVPTDGLSAGQRYYIVLRLEYGSKTVDWYSELPVRIVG